MEDKNKKVEREVEMEKILDVNQENNVEVMDSLTSNISVGLDKNKVYYKNRGFSLNLGGYGGFGNSSSKTRFTIILLLVIITIVSANMIYMLDRFLLHLIVILE